MKKIRIIELGLGFLCGCCLIWDFIGFYLKDFAVEITNAEFVHICLTRQLFVSIPFVLICLVDFVLFVIKELKEERKQKNADK